MRRTRLLLLFAFALAAAVGAAQEKESAPNQTPLKNTLEEYLLAWEYKDYEEMYEYLPSKAAAGMKKEDFIRKMKTTSYFPVEFKVARVKVKDRAARVWVDLYEKARGEVRKETISLVSENGKWKILPLYLRKAEISAPLRTRAVAGAAGSTSGEPFSPEAVSLLEGVDVNVVLDKMVEAGKSIQDFTSQVAITMPMMGLQATLTGSLVFKNPDKARIDLSAPTPLNIITNGKTLWTYASAGNIVFVNDISAMQGDKNLILGFGQSREQLLKDYDAALIGQSRVAGAPVYLLNFVPKQTDSRLDIKRIELYVDARRYIPVKTIAYYADKSVSMTFTGIATNTGAADSLFDFEVPAGANVSTLPLMDFF
jgi:outer membrane lipoprotein-sorting protein